MPPAHAGFAQHPLPRRIAVFRALQLGDMLRLVPALRALRAWTPKARITLIALPGAREFADRYQEYVDDFVEFPGYPGFPEQQCSPDGLRKFLDHARERDFDLALQMHDDGRLGNMLLSLMGARRMAGFHVAGGFCPDERSFIPWPGEVTEIRRHLCLLQALGIPLAGEHIDWPARDGDALEWQALRGRHEMVGGRYVCLHPGARRPSRRWPAQRYAQVASALSDDGWRVVVTGSEAERELAQQLVEGTGGAAINLAGETTLGSLAAVIAHSALLVCNDGACSQLAAALHTPSVVISSGSDAHHRLPPDRERHRVFAYDMACRPCTCHACPIGHPCALGVSVKSVVWEARALLRRVLRNAA
jgi:ADP-heptose:LPS heptosyltransferase